MHVAGHALRGRDRAGEDVADRVAALAHRGVVGVGRRVVRPRRRGRWRSRRGLAVVPSSPPGRCWPWRRLAMVGSTVAVWPSRPYLGIGQAVPRLAVVGVDDVAAGAARMAIVAGLVVGAHEPHVGVVEPGLVDVEHRDRDAEAGARAAVRLAEVGPARLLEPLDRAGRVGQADLGELGADVAAAALEHAEDVAGRDRRARSAADRARRARRGRAAPAVMPPGPSGELDPGRLAVAGIGLAERCSS